jgi:predicted MFS family arabinose efflux permease
MATAGDEGLRGRASARFEAATIAGLAGGFALAGPVWTLLGPTAFLANAVVYLGALAIYRYAVAAPDAPAGPHHRPTYGWRRYFDLLKRAHVWLLAPTWIAINAALGLYTSQTLFQLVRTPDPRFEDQMLVGGFSPLMIAAGFAVGAIIFFVGLWYWGGRFKEMRRTTIIFYGILGGALLVVSALALNHSASVSEVLRIPMVVGLAAGLFVLAGATPAALGLLADMSEAFPDDRGAIMGLYSVFLALGQILGAFIGGVAAESWAFDGILVATLGLPRSRSSPLRASAATRHGSRCPPPARARASDDLVVARRGARSASGIGPGGHRSALATSSSAASPVSSATTEVEGTNSRSERVPWYGRSMSSLTKPFSISTRPSLRPLFF